MKLYPFLEILETCERLIENTKTTIYQQWLCSHCGAKQTMPDQNAMYTQGICEECKQLTNIIETGCNYMAIMEIGAEDL